ncbi:MAG: lipopolysaccharide biosynthesis protein [Chloroflexi bacterium]|nr:lipopolysaccharide biosynthesis protein [Chloroflexota bacterium]
MAHSFIITSFTQLGAAYREWLTLFRRSWYSSVVSIAGQTLATITVALAGRGLGASSYGDVVAIVAFYGWFSLISGYTTHALLPRMIADPEMGKTAKSAACATTFWLTTSLTALATVPAVLLLPAGVRQFGDAALRPVAVLYALVFALGQINSVLLAISQSAGWLRQWSAVGLLGGILPVTLLLGYQAFSGDMTPLTYMGTLAITSLLTTGFSFVLFVRGLGGWHSLRPDRTLVQPMLRAGRGPWLATFSNVIASFGTNTLIVTHLTSRDLGHYDVALSLHTWVTTIGLAVTIPAMADWSRKLASRDYAAIRADFRLRQVSTAVVLGSAAIIVFVFAEPILYQLYGPDFRDAAPVLRLLVLSWVISGLGGWYWYFMFASGNPGRVAPPNLAFGIPSFLLTWALLSFTPIGLTGAVIARLIGLIAWLLTYEFNFRKVIRHDFMLVR